MKLTALTQALLLILIPITLSAAESATLPSEAKAAMDREAAQEATLKADFDAKVAKLHTDLIVRLKKALEVSLHREDLNGAEAIKAEIASLDGGKAVQTAEPSYVDYKSIRITKATFGIDDSTVDVLPLIRKIAAGDKLVITNENAGDPAPHKVKEINLQYLTEGGAVHSKTYTEGQIINLDALIR